MHIYAEKLEFLEGTKLQITFIDGKIMLYDMANLISKYPFLKPLENREFFLTGRIDVGGCGIVWNDDIDFDVMDAYECGELVGYAKRNINQQLAREILYAREKAGLTQVQLSKLSGIDQGDISRIEDGKGNPSLKKIEKIANALNVEVNIEFKKK